MLFKHLTPEQSGAMAEVYAALVAEDHPPLLDTLRAHFGSKFYKIILAAYAFSNLESFERYLEVPSRSGKAVLCLVASVLVEFFKEHPNVHH